MNLRVLHLFVLYLFVMCDTLQFEDEDCVVPATKELGTCISFFNCDYAKKLLQAKKNPRFCGFLGNTPLVCCPVHQDLPGTISQKMCSNYVRIETTEEIKTYAAVIDFGQKAQAKEFPHMAAVGFGSDKSKISWLCGGALISPKFILTAAHCVNSRQFGRAKWVRLGDLDLESTTEEANPQDLEIIAAYVHPNYNPPSKYNDIALLEMHKKVIIDIFNKPACLHTYKHSNVENVQAIGWGKQGQFGEVSSHLLKVSLKIVNHSLCAEQYSNEDKAKLKNGILDEFQLCAGDEAGGDTCWGDSGGPLHYFVEHKELEEHFVIVGITSFGRGCGTENSVGVYTRVSSYLDWIEKIVWPEEFI